MKSIVAEGIGNIEAIARQLTKIRGKTKKVRNFSAWEMARLYVSSYKLMADELEEQGIRPTPQNVNKAIRAVKGYDGPSGKWLSHTKKVFNTFPDLGVVNNTNSHNLNGSLPYDHYREIANSAVPDKQALRQWAEEKNVTQKQLREHIKELVGSDPTRPDFPLRVSNHWKFGERADKSRPVNFDGGIHPAIIANLLHYYTDPGDTVIDPMAGSGTTARVMEYYDYFKRSIPEQPYSGQREVLMSDIAPTLPDIVQVNAIEGLPWDDNIADLAILDPPYFGIADGKYAGIGDTIDEWRDNIKSIMGHCSRVVRTGGSIAVIVDDYNRSNGHHPLSAFVVIAGMELGLKPSGTIYNAYPNFVVTMNGAQMKRAKDARLQVNEMKVIAVFQV